uniref:Uncharacterized protein n=1 Tax=Rhizophora mucronata TaxID=61149 RepID=A0A2P2PZV0_RHIMU
MVHCWFSTLNIWKFMVPLASITIPQPSWRVLK